MAISLSDFTNITDVEKSRYLFLGKIHNLEKDFNESKVFPAFQNLITVYETICSILQNRHGIFLKEYTDKLDVKSDAEKQKKINGEVEKQFEFMEWTLPYLKNLLEQGKSIYDFVEHSINIESIGINSEHNLDGYMIIPDNKGKVFRIIRYNRSLQNMLKTREVDNYEWDIIIIPKEFLKNRITSNDFLNRIIYLLDTDLSFPYNETISPIARRKFLRFLEG